VEIEEFAGWIAPAIQKQDTATRTVIFSQLLILCPSFCNPY
jgi:hypothetical protein